VGDAGTVLLSLQRIHIHHPGGDRRTAIPANFLHFSRLALAEFYKSGYSIYLEAICFGKNMF